MDVDYKAIGRRIAARRKALKMTQPDLANKCDVSVQHISNIERATSVPSLETVLKIAMALETTPDTFLVGTLNRDDEFKKTTELLNLLDPYKLDFVNKFLLWYSSTD